MNSYQEKITQTTKITYSKNELLALKDAALSNVQPKLEGNYEQVLFKGAEETPPSPQPKFNSVHLHNGNGYFNGFASANNGLITGFTNGHYQNGFPNGNVNSYMMYNFTPLSPGRPLYSRPLGNDVKIDASFSPRYDLARAVPGLRLSDTGLPWTTRYAASTVPPPPPPRRTPSFHSTRITRWQDMPASAQPSIQQALAAAAAASAAAVYQPPYIKAFGTPGKANYFTRHGEAQ